MTMMAEILAWKCTAFYACHAVVRFFARQAYLLVFSEDDFRGLSRSMSSIQSESKRRLRLDDHNGHKLINHTFFCSIICALTCLVLGIGLTYESEYSWKFDPICAMVMAGCCIVEGFRICYVFFDDVDDLLTKHTRP